MKSDTTFTQTNGGITAPNGFRAAAVSCGIKVDALDLALIVSDTPANAAAPGPRAQGPGAGRDRGPGPALVLALLLLLLPS